MLRAEATLHGYDHAAIGDVVYAGDEEGFGVEFKNLIKVLDEAVFLFNARDVDNLKTLYSEFVTSVSRFKHQGFKEEQEVRLCVSPRDPLLTAKLRSIDPDYAHAHEMKKSKPILFKEGLVPYIDIFRDIEGDLCQ